VFSPGSLAMSNVRPGVRYSYPEPDLEARVIVNAILYVETKTFLEKLVEIPPDSFHKMPPIEIKYRVLRGAHNFILGGRRASCRNSMRMDGGCAAHIKRVNGSRIFGAQLDRFLSH